jgi:hypothetical protein
MDTSTKKQVEWGVYCENFVMIGLTVDSGDHFKNRAAIPLAPCTWWVVGTIHITSAPNFSLSSIAAGLGGASVNVLVAEATTTFGSVSPLCFCWTHSPHQTSLLPFICCLHGGGVNQCSNRETFIKITHSQIFLLRGFFHTSFPPWVPSMSR